MGKRNQFGLVGKNIGYSFSKGYFAQKFLDLGLDCSYENFDLNDISEFPELIQFRKNLNGLNVTIPYKVAVLPYLSKISKKANAIGAVNTIRFLKKGALKGYNTDYYGFKKSLQPLLEPHHNKALILGTGGASKAVAFALHELKIDFKSVSRIPQDGMIGYGDLTPELFSNYLIVINCTPIGTSPNVEQCPEIPYELFSPRHIAYDLVYNPETTLFLEKAKQYGATTKNGYDMLVFQAEKAWKIWNK